MSGSDLPLKRLVFSLLFFFFFKYFICIFEGEKVSTRAQVGKRDRRAEEEADSSLTREPNDMGLDPRPLRS